MSARNRLYWSTALGAMAGAALAVHGLAAVALAGAAALGAGTLAAHLTVRLVTRMAAPGAARGPPEWLTHALSRAPTPAIGHLSRRPLLAFAAGLLAAATLGILSPLGGALAASTFAIPARGRDSHLTARFRDRFPTWSRLRQFITSATPNPEFNHDRAMQQLLAADFAARLMADNPHDWLLFGSLALPMRPAANEEWQPDFVPAREHTIHPAYVMARNAVDLDLSALDIDHEDPKQAAREFGERISRAVRDVTAPASGRATTAGIGLGGMVLYRADVAIHPTGKVMGTVYAHPIDPRRPEVPVDNPIPVEIDIKPPNRVRLFGPAEAAHRPFVALDLPGFTAPTPNIYPTVSQLADKITMISGPPPESARRTGTAPWHRYKDLFDIYYMIRSCRIDADLLREAITANNLARFGHAHLPTPYRVFGHPATDGIDIPWQAETEALRAEQPQLARYPQFTQMEAVVSAFVAGLATTPALAQWSPHTGWSPPNP